MRVCLEHRRWTPTRLAAQLVRSRQVFEAHGDSFDVAGALVAPRRGSSGWRESLMVNSVRFGPATQEQLQHAGVELQGRGVQRALPRGVAGVDVGRLAQERAADLHVPAEGGLVQWCEAPKLSGLDVSTMPQRRSHLAGAAVHNGRVQPPGLQREQSRRGDARPAGPLLVGRAPGGCRAAAGSPPKVGVLPAGVADSGQARRLL
mmetsp:Transcript_24436/g.76884  ORF Transcript_24436/g.76884 Transcript_24436/m.76884 type:complete len:204 (+) Transcript_24436:623-1234(+)